MRKQIPRLGDARVIRRFLWFPLCLRGEERWLEMATICQEYRESWRPSRYFPFLGWVNASWEHDVSQACP